MKKEKIYKFFYAIAVLLIVGFAIRLGADHYAVSNSAPFYLFVIERSVEFLVPSIAAFVAGTIIRMKDL